MEQIKELLEILKQTPEMALWGITIYFLFILVKMASWIYMIKVIIMYFNKRLFNYLETKHDTGKGARILNMFESKKIHDVNNELLMELLEAAKGDNHFFHESNLTRAIKKLKE